MRPSFAMAPFRSLLIGRPTVETNLVSAKRYRRAPLRKTRRASKAKGDNRTRIEFAGMKMRHDTARRLENPEKSTLPMKNRGTNTADKLPNSHAESRWRIPFIAQLKARQATSANQTDRDSASFETLAPNRR